MEVPAGIPVSYTHDGVRVPVDGRAPGLFRCWVAIAITGVICASVGLAAPGGLLFWLAIATGFWVFWPVEHSVVELQASALRIFTDGGWERIPWDQVELVGRSGLVLTLVLVDGRRLQVPAQSSSRAAGWLVGVLRDLSERARQIHADADETTDASERLRGMIATIRSAS